MTLIEQFGEILQAAVIGMNVAVIADVIPVIPVRTRIDRIQPYPVNSQLFEIGNFFLNTLDIPDSVTVGIVKTTRVNLIKYGILPPLCAILHENLCYAH